MFDIQTDVVGRVIRVRMSGMIRPDEMREFDAAYRAATDAMHQAKHVVIADMRGFRPAEPASAQIFKEALSYARSRGVALCAHVSDSTIQRLQVARLARDASPGDNVTVDVVSVDEAEVLLTERLAELGRAG